MADYTSEIQQIYLAYYGRPADVTGLAYWNDALDAANGDLAAIIDSFGNSTESTTLYSASTTIAKINAIYLQLFNRTADAEGLKFYTNLLDKGIKTQASIALDILNGAIGDDRTLIDKKLLVAADFTAAMENDADAMIAYSSDDAAETARTMLEGVTADSGDVDVNTVLDTIIADSTGTTVTTGETFTLTTDVDTVSITTDNTIDTVKGIYFSDSTTDTFSFGDEIDGNGHTVVQVLVADATTTTAPYVTMSGVDALKVIAATSGTFTMDASTYGSDISTISLSGKDSFYLGVEGMVVEGSLDVSIAAAADSTVYATGTMDGLVFSMTLSNSDADTVGAVASVGTAGIDVVLGEEDQLDLTISQTSTESGAASVGDITIGDVSLEVGVSATASVDIYNSASSTASGAATAGSITLGDISMDIGVSASASLSVYNSVNAASGAATAGDITVGNIDVAVAASGSQDWFEIANWVDSVNGNATAGNITIGDINVVAADSASYALYLSVTNQATASTSGDATVGNISVGDVTITGGDDFSWGYFSLENTARADVGTATAGDITVGDITVDIGDAGGGYVSMYISNSASVGTTGDAIVGDITVGNVIMNAGSSNSVSFYIDANATTAKGAATVGDIVIGDISGNAGVDGSLEVSISITASGTTGDSIGNITIGNIDFYGEPSATLSFSLEVDSVAGTVGDVTLGDVDMKVDGSGELSYYVSIDALGDIGNVTIGDLTMTLGSSASLSYFTVDVSASSGDIGNFTVGDITIDAGVNASDDGGDWNITADGDLGDVSIGNVTINAATSASIDSFSMNFVASNGDIGNITLGNTVISAAASASVTHYLNFTAGNQIGDISVGDVTLAAATSGYVWLSHDYSASDDIGDISYGNISVAATGTSAYAGFSVEVDANDNSIGTVTIGDISLTASGSSATASVSFWFSDTGDAVGMVTVGDITLNLANTASAANSAQANFSLDSNGNVTVGDIAVTAGDITASFADSATMSADVTLVSDKNLTVGNITVVGGQANTNDVVLDNLGDLTTWLDLTAGGAYDVTIGDVDYSGYEATATIDVSGFSGAGSIWAAQGDTDITLNSDQNAVYLDAGDDTVDVGTGGTLKASASVIDSISNFTSGSDVIEIDTTGGSDFVFVTAKAANYAAFLTAAASNITNYGTDFYVGRVGDNLYLAVDKDAGSTIDFVIELTGLTTIDVNDITAY